MLITPLIREKHLHTSAWGAGRQFAAQQAVGGKVLESLPDHLGVVGGATHPPQTDGLPSASGECRTSTGQAPGGSPQTHQRCSSPQAMCPSPPIEQVRTVALLHSTGLEWPGRKCFYRFVALSVGGSTSPDLMCCLGLSSLMHMCVDCSPGTFAFGYRLLSKALDLLRALFNV